MSDVRLHKWVLLTHLIPPRPSGFRVKVWRKLQEIGAITVKNSVYVLPGSPEALEDFQWLRQEIVDAGGEAAVFTADAAGSFSLPLGLSGCVTTATTSWLDSST